MKTKYLCSRVLAGLLLLLTTSVQPWAANTKTTVTNVTTTVTLTDDVDYIVSSETPFGDNGVVNIANTDHAVLILSKVKPSAAIRLLASHVQINGAKAANNSNCQVKLYNRGCIILPYGNNIKPLTVYSEQNFGGEAVNDFGLEHTGGYMNTLTDAKLNNRIRSFKLKRGYMVTFALRAGGRGYSRCFIAADKDLEMATLPGVLDRSISSYRVFKWYDTGKKNLANDLTTATLNALNVTSSYTWSQGHDMAPDIECVPNHIYEDYPSSAAIGQATWSPHTKNNNEPRNTADDHPQDLNTILNNWENMMRTGMRLCSPASWDGSDYWNATGFLAEFLDSIDARGWRCDIIDLHCYWAEGSFGNLHYWSDKYKRPIWISEWCWGASWNSNGAFASGVTENQVRDALQRICNNLNSWNYVERYYYWNGERDPSRLYKNGSLTPAGEMYAQLDGGVGYNGKYDFAPKVPKQYDPSDLVVTFDKNTKSASLTWHEYNGEFNSSMSVQRRATANHSWVTIAEIDLQEQAADYSYVDTEATNGCQYQVLVIDTNNTQRKTKTVTAASSDLKPGDAIDLDGETKYVGGNVFLNGDFDMGVAGWTNGTGQPISQPYFQVVPVGGADGGAYLQCYGNGGADTESAVKTVFDVKPNTNYYFSGAVCNTTSVFTQLRASTDGVTVATKSFGSLSNTTGNWLTQFTTFNTEEYSKAIVSFRTLGSKTQVDQLLLCQLFDTQEEALADGQEKAIAKAELFKTFNTLYPALNENLPELIDEAIQAYKNMPRLTALIERAEKLAALELFGADELNAAISAARQATTATAVNEQVVALAETIDGYMPLVDADTQPKSPKFANATGWTTVCGTYTGGDQRTNSKDGVTFWNAWWQGLSASEGAAKTMEVKQDVTGLSHGLYSLECKASTEHYCLSDQHGYIVMGEDTLTTPHLTADYYDLPTVSKEDRWQPLLSQPFYVPDNGSVTIGFVGSKEGAVDNAWHEVGNTSSNGDKREGWWCATDFTLKFHPLFKTTAVPNQWDVICLPYAIRSGNGVRLYQVVGITSDYARLCLEEIESSAAGVACIFKADRADVTFLEYGGKVTSTTDAPGNIRGFLTSTSRVPVGYFHLEEGQWNKVTDSNNRPNLRYYEGIMRPFTDRASKQIPIFDEWAGETMPINGVTEEERTADVKLPSVAAFAEDGTYTIDGRNVYDSQLRRGIYIKVVNGQAQKFVIR